MGQEEKEIVMVQIMERNGHGEELNWRELLPGHKKHVSIGALLMKEIYGRLVKGTKENCLKGKRAKIE